MAIEILVEIDEIINKEVRPLLLRHSGDIRTKNYHDGILEIYLIGACSTCPSQHSTVKDLILNKLNEKIPDIKEINVINLVEEELINYAKKILSK